jgi:hypothetical protein
LGSKIKFCKLKTNNKIAYFTTLSEEDGIESVKLLDNAKFKRMTIKAEIVTKEEFVEFKVFLFLKINIK